MTRNRLALLLLAPLFASGPAAAGNLRVPESYGTIQAAIDAAAPGDTVLLAPGTYTDTALVSGKEALSIIGREGREKTIWDGGEKAVPLKATDNKGLLTVAGITFQRGTRSRTGEASSGSRPRSGSGIAASSRTVPTTRAGASAF